MADPPYDQIASASHIFNLLARAAFIRQPRRQAYIGACAPLPKPCADAFVQTRAGRWSKMRHER